ncbi:MAG TPA: hypothetical protein VHL11_02210, partial [Phototrophicaceae bacterium]|nr:hypothetical protein [Phototrophicaceae bacterium]
AVSKDTVSPSDLTQPSLPADPTIHAAPVSPSEAQNHQGRAKTVRQPSVQSTQPVQRSAPPAPSTYNPTPPVYIQPRQPTPGRTTSSARQLRRFDLPLIRAGAAAVVVLIAGAALFSGAKNFLNRGDTSASEIAYLRTETATSDASATNPFLMVTPAVTQPGQTPSTPPESVTQAVQNPTLTVPEMDATATSASSFQIDAAPTTDTQNQSLFVDPENTCTATNNTTDNQMLLEGPGVNFDVIDVLTPGSSQRVLVYTLEGWYQIMPQAGGRPMWIYGGTLTLNGDCERLVQPTPAPTADGSCVATGNGTVNIHVGPDDHYPVWNTLNLADRPTIGLKSDDGWVELRQTIAGDLWRGWSKEVSLEGVCDKVPYVAAQDFVPEPFPVLEATPSIGSSNGSTSGGSATSETPGSQPQIMSFTSSATTASVGDVITLSWQVIGVNQVQITTDLDGDGFNDSVIDNLPATGSTGIVIEPSAVSVQTFTLHAFATTPGDADASAAIILNIACPSVYFLFGQNCQISYQTTIRAQRFEHGYLLVQPGLYAGLVLLDDGSIGIPNQSDQITSAPVPPLMYPDADFGAYYRTALGWATEPTQSYTMTVERAPYDPTQPRQYYRLNLPDGRMIQIEQQTGGNFIGWNSVN